MHDEPNEDRGNDRRRGYSFRKHFSRLRVSGQLKNVGAATLASMLVVGITLARCQSSSITGPSSGPSASAPIAPSSATTSGQKEAIALFPASLLPSVHPCQPDVTFVEMGGSKNVTYTDTYETDANGNRNHDVSWRESTQQKGKDKNGKAYGTQKTQCPSSSEVETDSRGNCHTHFNQSGKSFHFQEHHTVKPEGSSAETCTLNAPQGSGGGNACPFNSEPSFTYTFMEDPLTHEAVMAVMTNNIVSSCSMTTLTMLVPEELPGALFGQ